MSVETVVEREKTRGAASQGRESPSWRTWVRPAVDVISSLRLTVVFLCLSVVLVFIGTLAQREEGLFAAQNRYFRSLFVWWSPTGGNWRVPVFPGGYLVGGVLIVNLLAAHARRFKFTKKKIGIFIIHAGLVLLILGQFGTDLFSKEGAMQLYEGESKNYSEAFRENELVIIDTSDAKRDRVYSIPESWLTRKGEIRDAELPVTVRVLEHWVNCDVEDRPPAEAIRVAADQGSFTNALLLSLAASEPGADQKRAAALVEVLSDKGSLGTFLVPARTSEQQTFKAGDREWALSLLFAPMAGGNQLVVSDASGARSENMVAFPEKELAPKAELRREGLPVTLRVKEFWPNCQLFRRPGQGSVQPAVTQGAYTSAMVMPLPRETDSEKRNYPAALIELADKGGSLGTFLVYAGKTTVQRFVLNEKPYELTLRFARYYYPFQLTLLKATHEQYKGTGIPKNFASRVRVENPQRNEARETVIYMNNPLRYAGLTFFQYQMTAGEYASKQGLRPSSTFEVVRNPGWLTPYLACGLVAGGLIIQFMTHLVGFAMKRRAA